MLNSFPVTPVWCGINPVSMLERAGEQSGWVA